MFRQLLESLDRLSTAIEKTTKPKRFIKEDITPVNIKKEPVPQQEELEAHMHSRNPKVRELVAKHINIHMLPLMMNDDDEEVRIQIAKRIDPQYLSRYEYDPSEDVRYIVVTRTEDFRLLNRMKQDTDAYIARRAVFRLRNDNVGYHE